MEYKNEMLPTKIPEIQRTNLGSFVLQLKAMDINISSALILSTLPLWLP